MVKRPSASAQAGPAEDLLKAAVVIGGIALGLMLLKYLLEGTDDEE
jgi:hypothetical protein